MSPASLLILRISNVWTTTAGSLSAVFALVKWISRLLSRKVAGRFKKKQETSEKCELCDEGPENSRAASWILAPVAAYHCLGLLSSSLTGSWPPHAQSWVTWQQLLFIEACLRTLLLLVMTKGTDSWALTEQGLSISRLFSLHIPPYFHCSWNCGPLT